MFHSTPENVLKKRKTGKATFFPFEFRSRNAKLIMRSMYVLAIGWLASTGTNQKSNQEN